ncbi:hypothetical protein L596_012558 [Steinernema carpocapsae]|uniref:Uncharacterized protein n=1 Tax=Steinernema carpocapsae TaxID=34508 RepID=A0A4U5NXN4_STECR|nr:hypothetical protein L596_012558 [Steinernema carpocapsae]
MEELWNFQGYRYEVKIVAHFPTKDVLLTDPKRAGEVVSNINREKCRDIFSLIWKHHPEAFGKGFAYYDHQHEVLFEKKIDALEGGKNMRRIKLHAEDLGEDKRFLDGAPKVTITFTKDPDNFLVRKHKLKFRDISLLK